MPTSTILTKKQTPFVATNALIEVFFWLNFSTGNEVVCNRAIFFVGRNCYNCCISPIPYIKITIQKFAISFCLQV